MAALMVSALPVLPMAVPASAAANKTSADAVGGATASARAQASGEPVEVTADRTEYSITKANPDGTFTLTQSASPQRVHADDGSWDPVDTTLVRRPDGTVGPKSTVVNLSFSGGGNDAMVKLGSERGTLRLNWPGRLPEPRLDGAKAVYAEVIEGVDLELTATAEGYREVLVVKSAEAAADSALERIQLPVSSPDLQVLPGAGVACAQWTGTATPSSTARPARCGTPLAKPPRRA